MSGKGEEGGPPGTIMSGLHKAVKETELGRFFSFNNEDRHLGQYWFEAVCFSIIVVVAVSLLAILATRRYQKVPRGLQNFFEIVYEAIGKLVTGLIGPDGLKYLPYLGTLFIYIFAMNLLGIIPLFRSPTMTLSTTLALGITTFFVVQYCGIRANGPIGYLKHFMGPVIFLAPLMFVVEIIGEIAKPMSLSLRLYGNIFGEDSVIESLMHMGGYVPVHLPMLAFAVFTSFLQAFIFTSLASIYIGTLTAHHEEEHAH